MPDVGAALSRLDDYSRTLDDLSKALADCARKLEPVADEYQDFIDTHELGLYDRSESEDDFKLPSEAIRLKLALRAMPLELRGRYRTLKASQDRMTRRLGDLKALVDAQRSILSALKTEADATRT